MSRGRWLPDSVLVPDPRVGTLRSSLPVQVAPPDLGPGNLVALLSYWVAQVLPEVPVGQVVEEEQVGQRRTHCIQFYPPRKRGGGNTLPS